MVANDNYILISGFSNIDDGFNVLVQKFLESGYKSARKWLDDIVFVNIPLSLLEPVLWKFKEWEAQLFAEIISPHFLRIYFGKEIPDKLLDTDYYKLYKRVVEIIDNCSEGIADSKDFEYYDILRYIFLYSSKVELNKIKDFIEKDLSNNDIFNHT